jgi:hypothetical protein
MLSWEHLQLLGDVARPALRAAGWTLLRSELIAAKCPD